MLSDDAALQTASDLHNIASQLLAGSLGNAIRRLGRIVPSGSYYLDVMVWPDIDVYVKLKESDAFYDGFLSLAVNFRKCCESYSLNFRDHIANPVEELPEGLYWGVRFNYQYPTPWKLDLWAVPQVHIKNSQTELDRLKRKMTAEHRELILKTKASLITDAGRTPPLSSYPIYCAVLDLGLSSVEAVVNHLRLTGVIK
jgi:hypothetical protein